VNRRAGADSIVSEPLPDTPWPVVASNLLTRREQSLYEGLLSLYPNHRIFVQVALSQLIDVPEDQPERQSIRNRFSQLVADFVLCRPDLTVVAVIELDDRSHERRDRQDADARKAKALVDAGLRLVRIPAGNLPPKEDLRKIIDADCLPSGDRSENPKMHRFIAAEAEPRLGGEWASTHTDALGVNHERAAMRALKVGALKMVLAGIVIVGGWFVYAQFIPAVVQRAFQPLAIEEVPNSTAVPHSSSTGSPPWITTVPTQQELAEKRRAELRAAADLQRQKDHAWLANYSAPASCEHPVDWNAQVECGNQYMRAKKDFEKQWLADHPSGEFGGAAIVLDNGSIGGARK
jgi:hypothetical protein